MPLPIKDVLDMIVNNTLKKGLPFPYQIRLQMVGPENLIYQRAVRPSCTLVSYTRWSPMQ